MFSEAVTVTGVAAALSLTESGFSERATAVGAGSGVGSAGVVARTDLDLGLRPSAFRALTR